MKRLLRTISAATQNDDFEISNGKLIKYHGDAATVVIPNGVTSIGPAVFNGCTSLTSITIPDSVTSIGEYAFYVCKSLKSIKIPDSVTKIGDDAFSNCTSLTSVKIGNSVKEIGDEAFYECTGLTSVAVPDSVESIGKYAFANCTNLTRLTIPASVTKIANSAFSGCNKLPKNYTSQGRKANPRKSNSKKVTLYCAYKLWGRAYSGGVSDVTVTGNSLANAIWEVSEYVTGVNSRLEDFVYDYCDREGIEIPDTAYAEDFISQVPDAELIDFMKENEWEEEWQIFVLLNETTHEFYIGEEFKDDPYNTRIMDKDDWDASNDEYDDDEDGWV